MDDVLDKPPQRSLVPVVGVLVAFMALLCAVGYFYWTNRQPANPIPQAPLPSSTSTVPTPSTENPTSTPPVPSSTSTQAESQYRQGDTLRLFQGDEVLLWSQDFPRYRLQAVGFTDSRCPEGVQCIWAGERGVDMRIVLEGTEAQPKNFSLREKTATSTSIGDLKLILIGIDDSKGGTYADIKVE